MKSKKYVGVQSWKAMHLPTLDIRVEQKGNRAMIEMGNSCMLSRHKIRPFPVYFWLGSGEKRSDMVRFGLVLGGKKRS